MHLTVGINESGFTLSTVSDVKQFCNAIEMMSVPYFLNGYEDKESSDCLTQEHVLELYNIFHDFIAVDKKALFTFSIVYGKTYGKLLRLPVIVEGEDFCFYDDRITAIAQLVREHGMFNVRKTCDPEMLEITFPTTKGYRLSDFNNVHLETIVFRRINETIEQQEDYNDRAF